MRALQPQLNFLHVEITSQLVVVTQSSWSGNQILMKMNKNLLKISEQNQLQQMQEECQLQARKDQPPLRGKHQLQEVQKEVHHQINLNMVKLQELEGI
jgi:hypothetical protein